MENESDAGQNVGVAIVHYEYVSSLELRHLDFTVTAPFIHSFLIFTYIAVAERVSM